MTVARKIGYTLAVLAACQLTGCAGTGSMSTSTSVHYGSYYDPYSNWGNGGDTTVIVTRPDEPERPISKPPVSKPPGGIGRPKPQRRGR